MSDRPIAYVMEQTLGSVTHYLNLRREESAFGGPGPRWIPIEFRGGMLPWTLTGGWIARRALDDVLPEVDGIFMHTTTIAPLSADLFRKKPTIVSTDATPWSRRSMRDAYGMGYEGPLYARAKREVLRKVLSAVAGLVGWSEWAKTSLVEDYGCREEDVAIIPPGVDTTEFAPGDRDHRLPRILFVGGDFGRKGGYLLLDVFRRRLRGRAELVLVTQGSVVSEPGIEVHRNLAANSPELRKLYATSDIFALPTLADCYSLVAIEALAAGLPVVVTRIGGIPDVILEGKTGHLVEPGDSDQLGDVLEMLIDEPGRRAAMGESARADALLRFDGRENARRLFEFVRSRC